jgi:hypothetical protein
MVTIEMVQLLETFWVGIDNTSYDCLKLILSVACTVKVLWL